MDDEIALEPLVNEAIEDASRELQEALDGENVVFVPPVDDTEVAEEFIEAVVCVRLLANCLEGVQYSAIVDSEKMFYIGIC